MIMAQPKDDPMNAPAVDDPMNAPAVAEDRMEEDAPRALDFGNEPALPRLEVVKVPYTVMPIAYDVPEMENTSVYDLVTSGTKIVFKFRDKYFSTDIEPLQNAFQDKSSTFYECIEELTHAPYTEDVHPETPYFRVQLNGNFMVPETELRSALASGNALFELVPTAKKLPFVTSYAQVQVSPGVDGLGRQVDISGADHCQKGSQQVTYTLKEVKMIKQAAGKKTRKTRKPKKKSTFRKAKKINKRKTYRSRK